MKKIGLIIGMSIIMTLNALMAQTTQEEKRPLRSAETRYERLGEKLQLNENQKKQLKEVDEKFVAERKQKVERTKEQREQEQIAWATKQIEREDAIRKILTKEQYAKYYAQKHLRHQNMRPAGQNKRAINQSKGRFAKDKEMAPRRQKTNKR